jgi:sterol desaturase/sphingolipid hydroxylase (fatty acid hydroxylase superfamily)
MSQQPRPTSVTVIGWASIVLGVLAILSSSMAIGVQLPVGALGLMAGISFLKRRRWSRGVLELLTWLVLVFVVSLGAYFLAVWTSMFLQGQGPSGFWPLGAVMGVVITAVCALPLGIMLKHLRGERVKTAML